ncbi:glucose 1-dehydrogenase [Nocardia seriolae]|uniref:3-alpha-hydroxysteroid dehydrogenase n=1 Tax=Nocardia seriolae TaxID=37332 RepID=A0A0B8NA74_9NOCA|nr:glucose 1-dehydrogenase [Nocardia seriolae]MTJ65409.1 glucose 1-dehydrogenase [Nocardia seriolae]MTJ70833.1 glucose 1-dehydrogenase [Nocardia seriolae]MTJ90293.1 glucose 1-dehydrogenase [Nocardia seriolae]MTK34256.1 glucose 1-dehydrogenase [Nocardia seriolae]MTK43395.1 glucose 1-dehydrogenase [Nocardia seriolae]
MGRVDSKVVIVTGGARGMGAAFARKLAAEGARVVITDVLTEAGQAVAAEIGDAARFFPLDVTDEAAWNDVVARAEAAFGPISGLVNNAGIVHVDPIEKLTEADYRKVIDVNQIGVFLGMKVVIGSMRRAGVGSIVNISSTGGLIGYSNILGYVASKWAVRGMSKMAAQEFAADNVRVNSVHPGIVATEMVASSDRSANIAANQPIARPASPEELANLVLFLISDDSSYSTGSEFVADGGFTSQ